MSVANVVKTTNFSIAERITAHKALPHTRYWRGFSFLIGGEYGLSIGCCGVVLYWVCPVLWLV